MKLLEVRGCVPTITVHFLLARADGCASCQSGLQTPSHFSHGSSLGIAQSFLSFLSSTPHIYSRSDIKRTKILPEAFMGDRRRAVILQPTANNSDICFRLLQSPCFLRLLIQGCPADPFTLQLALQILPSCWPVMMPSKSSHPQSPPCSEAVGVQTT